MTDRKFLLPLLALALVGLLLHGALTHASWVDEITTQYRVAGYGFSWPWSATEGSVNAAAEASQKTGSASRVLNQLQLTGIHPPLYYLTRVAVAPLFGNTLTGARLFSALMFGLSIWALWQFVRLLPLPNPLPGTPDVWGGALSATLLYAFASIPVAMAQDGRYYTFTLFVLALVLGQVVKMARAPAPHLGATALCGFELGCLAASHYIVAPLGIGVAIYMAYDLWRKRPSAAGWIGHLLVFGMCALPLGLLGLQTFLMQSPSAAGSAQLSGFPGFLPQIAHAAYSLPKVMLAEPADLYLGRLQSVGLVLVFAAALIPVADARYRGGVLFVAGLTALQLGAMVLVSFALHKHMAQSIRYNALLAPLLAPMLIYGLAGLTRCLKVPQLYGPLFAGLLLLQLGRAVIGNDVDGWPHRPPTPGAITVYLQRQTDDATLYLAGPPTNNFYIATILYRLHVHGVDRPVHLIEGAAAIQDHPFLVLRWEEYLPPMPGTSCQPLAEQESVQLLACRHGQAADSQGGES